MTRPRLKDRSTQDRPLIPGTAEAAAVIMLLKAVICVMLDVSMVLIARRETVAHQHNAFSALLHSLTRSLNSSCASAQSLYHHSCHTSIISGLRDGMQSTWG